MFHTKVLLYMYGTFTEGIIKGQVCLELTKNNCFLCFPLPLAYFLFSDVCRLRERKARAHRVILRLRAVILHLVSLKSVYEKYIRFEVQICYTTPKLTKYYENDGNYIETQFLVEKR